MKLREVIERIDEYNDLAKSHFKTLGPAEALKFDQENKLNATYYLNSLEKNTMTLKEVEYIIKDNVVVGGRKLRKVFETVGHGEAFDYVLGRARSGDFAVTEDLIKEIHHLYYRKIDDVPAGRYRLTPASLRDDEAVVFPPPAEVGALVRGLVDECASLKGDGTHPIALAVYAHLRLAAIHPFEDGNGAVARLLAGSILVADGYQALIIYRGMRQRYRRAVAGSIKDLKVADLYDNPFLRFMIEQMIVNLKDYFFFHGLEPPYANDLDRNLFKLQF